MTLTMRSRTLLMAPLVALAVALSQQAVAPAAHAAPPSGASAGTVSAGTVSAGTASTTMSLKDYRALERDLDANPTLRRSVRVSAGVRTLTYAAADGVALSLQFPVSSTTPSPKLGVGGCGFLQLCVYFNRTDQGAIAAGAAAGLAVLICAVTSPAGCAAAAVVLAMAAYYIDHFGICRNQLRVRILPFPGGAKCV